LSPASAKCQFVDTVALVDIVAELDDAVLGGPGGEIGEINRHRLDSRISVFSPEAIVASIA
jgi:hypothetical protein